MGKSREKKTGKGRLDKWYQLAKEQGYRARSAFKLVQLNKKYDFLASSKCVIDLCAAPGGWLQVAAKNMPSNSLIIGVDLVPIKPIPRCITLVDDITTEKCRADLRREMKDWKADVVMHDGAPNVGSAWVQDAFTQVELVLSSLKLATEFLTAGGTFVTKVFRSKDYNSLLWVFNQLFQKVEATKPPSSRNVSAEIFVVCQGYLAPAKIDPRFLNAKHVFGDLDTTTSTTRPLDALANAKISTKDVLSPATLNVFHPEKKRKQRDGYDATDVALFKECNVMDWINSNDPIGVLGMVGRMNWGTDECRKLKKHPLTTDEIKACLEDLKVLGKKDFKNLLKYRLAVREELGIDVPVEDTADATEVDIEPLDEEEQISNELERLAGEEALRRRKDRRRTNEKRNRDVLKMQLNMVTPMDIGLERQDGIDDSDMFDLGEIQGNKYKKGLAGKFDEEYNDVKADEQVGKGRKKVVQQAPVDDEEEEDEDEDERKTRLLEASLDQAYEQYQQERMERDTKAKARELRKKRAFAEGGEWGGIDKDSDASSDEEEEVESEDDDPAPLPSDSDSDSDSDDGEDGEPKLLTSLEDKKKTNKERQANIWFDQPVFKGLPGLENLLGAGEESDSEEEEEDRSSTLEGEAPDGFEDEDVEMDDDEEESEEDDDSDDFEGAVEEHEEASDMEDEADMQGQEAEEKAKAERIEALGLTTAEAMTLAQQLVNNERTRTQLVDEGFNRQMGVIGGDGLPTWFLDDEQRHFRNNVPVTKDAIQAIRDKQRELNARPIKKIAEAKARKKMRTIRRMEKTRAKMQGITEDDDSGLTEREKAQSIAKILAKSAKSTKPVKPEIKLVVAKGSNRALKGRPKGVKGRYKMVDSRGKKELRALKRIAKRDRKNGGRRK